MNKPELSPDFTMDDIRKLRDYNSFRHVSMTLDEIREDMRPSVEEFAQLMAERKDKKRLASVS